MTGLSGGAITLASGQTLAGNGSVAGGVVAASGSHVAPGIGTLTMGSLNMANGSIYDYQFNNTPATGLINVNTTGGLTINRGGFNLYNLGTTTPFATPGTYKLLQYSGALGGAGISALSVLDRVSGMAYKFTASTRKVDLSIQPVSTITAGTPTNTPSPPSGNLMTWNNQTQTWQPVTSIISSEPTVVITHGWNGQIADTGWTASMASALTNRQMAMQTFSDTTGTPRPCRYRDRPRCPSRSTYWRKV